MCTKETNVNHSIWIGDPNAQSILVAGNAELALENLAFISFGGDQFAFNVSLYQAILGSIESQYAEAIAQIVLR